MSARDRLQLPWPTAVRAKWELGKATHGPQWQGDHPLIELHEELLDAENYLTEAARREELGTDHDEWPYEWQSQLETIRGLARWVHRKCHVLKLVP